MNPGFWGMLIIAIAILVLFGRGKVLSFMTDLGAGLREFKRGMIEERDSTDQPVHATRVAQLALIDSEVEEDGQLGSATEQDESEQDQKTHAS
jgi:sec-independent protein translocase protein TatA